MSGGSFVNLTGVKGFDQIPQAMTSLQKLLPNQKLTFSNKRVNTISAHVRLPQYVFLKLLQHEGSSSLFLIKQYDNMSCKINVQLLHPLKSSPNLCANMFKSGGVCLFGSRNKDDLETFLSIIHNFAKS